MTDWGAWHAGYDDPESSLARRLEVVRRHVREALAARGPTAPGRVLSLCAGDGRDVLPEVARIDGHALEVVLVERDPTLAADAGATAERLGLDRVTVIEGDAGETGTFTFALPVDLLLLCGIFGNVPDDAVATTVAALPTMLRPGATVIWTRGSRAPDLRPAIRRWVQHAGLAEIAFVGEPAGFAVGVARAPSNGLPSVPLPSRLFAFVR